MSVVFLGDVAVPPGIDPGLPAGFGGFDAPAVVNLEGTLAALGPQALRGRKIWNDHAALPFLRRCGVRAVSLANNHVLDAGVPLDRTVETLRSWGFDAFGGGRTLAEAVCPAVLDCAGHKVAVLGFGWEVIGCKPATARRAGINPLRREHVIASVEKVRAELPEARIALMMHWNYEGEAYPQPGHRRVAFDAIDAGADVVVGCHSHCVAGIELHHGRPVVHGLGNWFMGTGRYWGGRHSLPVVSRLQLAFHWQPQPGHSTCHWFEFTPERQALEFRGSERIQDSARVANLTPYAGMDDREYSRWFRAHRRKRRWLPVYEADDGKLHTALKDGFVRVRARAIDAGVALGLKRSGAR